MSELVNRTHGKAGTYTAGCHCTLCTDAWAEYSRRNVKQRAYRRAGHAAAQWVRANRPDVWVELRDAAEADIRRVAR